MPKLALARLNLGAAAGTPALTSNDGSGALALADAGKATVRFDGAGGTAATSTSTPSAISSTLAFICLRVWPRNRPRMMMFS